MFRQCRRDLRLRNDGAHSGASQLGEGFIYSSLQVNGVKLEVSVSCILVLRLCGFSFVNWVLVYSLTGVNDLAF